MCVFAGSLPRNVDVDVYAGLIRELKRLGVVDASSTPTATRCAAPCAPSPTSSRPNVLEAEELVGHEFNDEEDHCIAVREMVELGAREAIMTAPDGCYAQMLADEPGAPPSPVPGARAPGRDRAARDRRLGRRVPRRLRRRPLQRPRRSRSAWSTASPAARESTQHLGAGLIDPRPGRAPDRGDRGRAPGAARPRSPERSTFAGSVIGARSRPPRDLGSRHGS